MLTYLYKWPTVVLLILGDGLFKFIFEVLGPVIFQAFPRLLSFTMIVKANLDFFLTMFVVTLFTYVMHGSVV